MICSRLMLNSERAFTSLCTMRQGTLFCVPKLCPRHAFLAFDHVWQNLKSITYAASIMGGRTNPSSSATYPSKVVCNHAGVAFAFWVIPILSIQDLQSLCRICLARVDLRRRAIQGHPQGVLQDCAVRVKLARSVLVNHS
jgi:hypothetical protein